MIDVNFVRENPELVAKGSMQKGVKVDIDKLLKLDQQRRDLLNQMDAIRQERNQVAQAASGKKPEAEQLAKGQQLKTQLAQLENEFKTVDKDYLELLRTVPNMPLEDVPVGSSEDDNVVYKSGGTPPQFAFTPLSHQEIGEKLGLIDKVRAAKIAGSRFAYLKGDLVRLQFAIVSFVISELGNPELIAKLIADNHLNLPNHPFVPVLPPALLKTAPYEASARLNAEETTYKVEQDDLWLNASAEHTLCTMFMDEVLPKDELPLRFIGYSTSFRREAGSYGKDFEGILRLHQFDKLEMEVFSTPESGLEEHRLLVAIQEHLVSSLGLPYQMMNKCTFDIGKPNARGVDVNTWFPSQQLYRETHSADYLTDYQTRDLKIRTRMDNGKLELVHTNDATAFALGRILAAIIENYQDQDGHFSVPPVLVPFMGGQVKI